MEPALYLGSEAGKQIEAGEGSCSGDSVISQWYAESQYVMNWTIT